MCLAHTREKMPMFQMDIDTFLFISNSQNMNAFIQIEYSGKYLHHKLLQ